MFQLAPVDKSLPTANRMDFPDSKSVTDVRNRWSDLCNFRNWKIICDRKSRSDRRFLLWLGFDEGV